MTQDPPEGKYGALDTPPVPGAVPGGAKGAGGRPEIVAVLTAGETVYRVNKDKAVIGSVDSVDVRLTGEGVAPIHAVLEINGPGHCVIYDLASETGIFVNGKKTVTAPLSGGEKIKIGQHEFVFTLSTVEKQVPRDRVRTSGSRNLMMNPTEDLGPLLLESEREVQEIFDYAPSQKRALEVVMSWQGMILDVEHFVREREVTVGVTRESDFGIPPLLSAGRYAMISRSGEDFVLNLDGAMKGVMQRKGTLQSIDDLRKGLGVGSGSSQIPLSDGDFVKISIGEVDFYMSFTAAPPRLKPSKVFERDPFLLKILGASLALTVLMINMLMHAQVPLNLEAEQIPERIATILYQPEKYVQKRQNVGDDTPSQVPTQTQVTKPAPTPTQVVKIDIKPNPNAAKKPVPKEMVVTKSANEGKSAGSTGKRSAGQREAKEGKGARAKGNEGKRGKPNAPADKTSQDKANRPSPQGGAGAGAGNSQVKSIGNVDILNSATAKISNLLGDSAEKLGKGGEKLKGFGGFTTQGTGGLALSGGGKGGGGTAEGLGGLADKGTGGGKIGTGRGATGSGSGIIGGQARVAIRSGGPEEAVVMGTIDADAVEAALLAHRDEFRLCYEKEINAEHPSLAGRVSTSFVIGSSGRVNQAGIESTTLKNANTERCILNVIRRIDFPIPRGAGLVQVTYPFKFSPTGH